MKKEIAKKWVAALRSGKYRQAHNVLRSPDNAFCCLGVLCNLHAQQHPEFARTQTNPSTYDHRTDFPPLIVRQWAGLKTENGGRLPGSAALSILNDNGRTFKQIARIIEQNVEHL